MRACCYAVAAADAFTAVRSRGRIDIHPAGMCAGFAVGAFALFVMHAVQGDFIEETVDRAQGADVFTERPVDDEACGKDQAEDDEFEAEQAAELICYLFVCGCKPKSCDGSRRADILAEERRQLEAERKYQYEKREHHILEIPQILIELEFVLLEKRYLVQKVLQKAERAEKTAYCAPNQGTYEDQYPDNIIGNFEFETAQIILEGPYGTGAYRAGARVAVESRNAYGL